MNLGRGFIPVKDKRKKEYLRDFIKEEDYDIIMLAPQISYLLPQVEVLLPEKDIVVIPTKIFAMNDFSGALMIINELLENKEKN